jgi:capsular polysaccharide biosynthesis protein
MKIQLSDSFVCFRKKPINISIDTAYLYHNDYKKDIPTTYLIFQSHVSVLNDTLYSHRENRFYIEETHLEGSSFNLQDKLERFSLFFKPYVTLHKGVWITMNWTEMYYHWICDALTRLTMCLPYLAGHKVMLPESYRQLPFVMDSLALIGITPFFYKTNNRVKVKEVIIPSHVANSGDFNHTTLLNLKKLYAPYFIENTQRRIFISRSNSTKRNLKNEHVLYPVLLKFGFEILHFETITFLEQIKISSQSSIICGLHGAGFTNMLFMPEGAKVFEIQIENEHNNCFFSMSSELNFNYWFLQAKSIAYGVGEVDVIEFENVLHQVLAS